MFPLKDIETIWAILGRRPKVDRSQVRWVMWDEQGDTSTPLLVYWIDGLLIYQSDQLAEVGVYWRKDSKKASMGREGGVVIDFLRLRIREDFW